MKVYRGDETLLDNTLDATDLDLAGETAARIAADEALQDAIDGIVLSSGVDSIAGLTGTISAAAIKTALNLPADTVASKQDADADLTAIAGLSPFNNDVLQRKAGAWTNRTIAQLKADLAYVAADIPTLAPVASPAFTGNPTVPTATPGDNDTTIANTAFVTAALAVAGASLPTGAGALWLLPGAVPNGWLECNGQAVSRTTYSDLHTLVAAAGYPWGNGDGSTTFNVPDLRGRSLFGQDTGQTEFDTLSEVGGAKSTTLIEANLPPHAHSIAHDHANATTTSAGSHTHSIYVGRKEIDSGTGATMVADVGGYGSGQTSAGYGASSSAGSHQHAVDIPSYAGNSGNGAGTSTPFTNLPPYFVGRFIIKT